MTAGAGPTRYTVVATDRSTGFVLHAQDFLESVVPDAHARAERHHARMAGLWPDAHVFLMSSPEDVTPANRPPTIPED